MPARVEVGKSADFIVLDANPLDDIKNTRRIANVYLRGGAVDRAAVRARMNDDGLAGLSGVAIDSKRAIIDFCLQ